MNLNLDLEAIRQFTRRLPARGKVLEAGCTAPQDFSYLVYLGFDVDGITANETALELSPKVRKVDFRMLNLPKETYDGVWANESLVGIPVEGVQRVVANLFSTLKSGGMLFASIRPTPDYRSDDFASLLRQNGFKVLQYGQKLDGSDVVGFIAERI